MGHDTHSALKFKTVERPLTPEDSSDDVPLVAKVSKKTNSKKNKKRKLSESELSPAEHGSDTDDEPIKKKKVGKSVSTSRKTTKFSPRLTRQQRQQKSNRRGPAQK